MDTNKFPHSLIGAVVVGYNFGMWQENIFAGLWAALITFYAFTFRYD